MLTVLARLAKRLRLGRWAQVATLLGCLALSSCRHIDLRGEKFPEDELSELSRRLRPRDTDAEPAGMANKARQIEADLGVR